MGRSGGGGMTSMMDEMQKTLARRRAKVDRGSEEPEKSPGPGVKNGALENREKGASPGVGKVGQESQEKGTSPGVGKGGQENQEKGTSPGVSKGPDTYSSFPSSELDAMKQEILREMRKEVNKAKQEIIDVIRQELARK